MGYFEGRKALTIREKIELTLFFGELLTNYKLVWYNIGKEKKEIVLFNKI